MTFWLIAAAIAALTALVLYRPLLRRGSSTLGLGLALILMLPMATGLIYLGVGSPQAINMPDTASVEIPPDSDMNALVAELQTRMDANPDDVAGWMLLGRSYRSLQRFDESYLAFQRALELEPNDPGIMVEVAEAMIFAAGPGNMNPEVPGLLEAALNLDPNLQKGLWLSGMVAMQEGNDTIAIQRWERLMPLLEPGSPVASSVQQQIDAARTRLGAPLTTPEDNDAWAGISVTVLPPENLPPLTPESALFIIARDPASPNPPLGAMRLAPAFPAEVTITDANSMLPQRPISSVREIQLEARLSISGQPLPSEGDPQSEAVIANSDGSQTVELQLKSP